MGHVLTITFDDDSVVQFAISLEAEPVPGATLIFARPRFVEITSVGGSLEALNAGFVPYSTLSYDLFVVAPTAYEDFNFTPVEPAHYRYENVLLLGDGSGHFVVPEPTSLFLVGAGLFGAGLCRRRRRRTWSTSSGRSRRFPIW